MLMLLPATTQATEAGLWYTGANPDFKPFSTEYGFGITLYEPISDDAAITLLHNETDFNPSGPLVGRLQVDSWTELAYQYALDSNFYVSATYTTVATNAETLDGLGIHIGYQFDWSDALSSTIQFGQIDTSFKDYQLVGALNYQLADNVEIAFKLRDYHDWDFTAYEAGLIYSF